MLPGRVVESGVLFFERRGLVLALWLMMDNPGAVFRGVVMAYAVVGGVSPGRWPVSTEVANAVSAP